MSTELLIPHIDKFARLHPDVEIGTLSPWEPVNLTNRVAGPDSAGAPVAPISGYCPVSVMLNAFDMSVPGSEESLG
ncbi:hypothetical protein [Lichenicola sp.]|uniref:hypothetical protein n=1 Tax=Lichenicola sp. TaxID=2804529 RepID=UPI003AFFD8FE